MLTYIITIAKAAVLSGIKSYDEIKDFGLAREDWLNSFLQLPNGIHSHDTRTTKNPIYKRQPISIYAMGYQQDIAECIANEQGDYLLAVKDNQRPFYQNIEDSFRFQKQQAVMNISILGMAG